MSIDQWVSEYLAKPSKLLIVDDTDGIAESIKAALKGYECEFTVAFDGEAAINAVRDEKFDLIFLDMMLPKHSGVEVLKVVKQVAPETPVVIMTGFCDNTLLEEASRLGIVSFLRKPIDFSPSFIKQVFHLFKLRGAPTHSIFASAA